MNAKSPKRSNVNKFPIAVSEGSATVKVYDTAPKSGAYKSFTVIYWLAGRRERKVFGKLDDALAEADRVVVRLANAQTDALKLNNKDVAIYCEAVETLKPHGIPLHHAVKEFAEARTTLAPHGCTLATVVKEYTSALSQLAEAKLPGVTLPILVDYYLRRHVTGMASTTVTDAVETYAAELDKRASRKEISDEYARVVGVTLGKFAESFNCNLDAITGEALKTWLDNRGGKSATINGYRGALMTFFKWCQDNKLLPKTWDEHDAIQRRADTGDIDAVIYRPADMKKMLLAAHEQTPALLPFVAIAGFAGLRTAEITRLRWQDFRLPADKPDRRWIIVPSENKTGRRVVPVKANLYAWLRPYIQTSGFLVPREYLQPGKPHALNSKITDALAANAGLKWQRNALRKSYASYRLAETGNSYTTAEETGHAVAVLKRVYREVVTADDASEWFGLMPPEGYAANLIPIPVGTTAAAPAQATA